MKWFIKTCMKVADWCEAPDSDASIYARMWIVGILAVIGVIFGIIFWIALTIIITPWLWMLLPLAVFGGLVWVAVTDMDQWMDDIDTEYNQSKEAL